MLKEMTELSSKDFGEWEDLGKKFIYYICDELVKNLGIKEENTAGGRMIDSKKVGGDILRTIVVVVNLMNNKSRELFEQFEKKNFEKLLIADPNKVYVMKGDKKFCIRYAYHIGDPFREKMESAEIIYITLAIDEYTNIIN